MTERAARLSEKARNAVLEMRRIFCCKGAEFARPQLQLGWETIESLLARLEQSEGIVRELKTKHPVLYVRRALPSGEKRP